MTELYGPGWGNYAIRGIVEVVEPAAVSLLPQTPGWWILAALVAAWAIGAGWRRWRRWQRNAYRREALSLLVALRARIEGGEAEALAELAPLLRATVLNVLPRNEAAALRGDAWRAALAELAPRLSPLPVERIHAWAYMPAPESTEGETATVVNAVEQWIRLHRGPDD